jgi:hypothetical protein
MCDYSLHNVASRPAKVGDRLVTTEFPNTTTRGFTEIDKPTVAVCLLPGTELVFDEEAEYWHPFARLLPSLRFGKLGGKEAVFRQMKTKKFENHRDALEFPDGKMMLLTRLRPGQRATVIQLPITAGSGDQRSPLVASPSASPVNRDEPFVATS